MKLPEINEPEGPAKEDPKGPAVPRTVHIVAARKTTESTSSELGPAQAAAEIKASLPPPEDRKEEPHPSGEAPAPEEKPQRNKGLNPGKKLRSIILAGKNAPFVRIPLKYRLRPDKSLLRRAVWDVSSIISLSINIVLVVIVVILGTRLQQLQSSVNSLLGGLYDNFVRMDNSVISTSVSVNQPIELDFILPVVQPSTNVTLTDNVVIHNASVVINTGVLNINSRATVTLPAGTTLPVSLSMDVPVKTTVPVNLTIPINIKLSEASSPDPNTANLHSAFTGLQNTIGPLYCLLQPGAIDSAGRTVCDQGSYFPKPLR